MLLRMKRTILCFLLLLSFAACHRFDGAKQSLLLIDSLSVSEPERALSLLDSMQAQSDSLPRRLRMKYHFLRVRAKDKAYQSLQSDTIMERVARYYRHHGTANEAMEATYLLGGVYRDRGESPRALDVYLSASEQADTTRPDCNYGILARIHGQMAELFEKQFLREDHLEEINKAKYYALRGNDSLAYLLFDIQRVFTFQKREQDDSLLNLSLKSYKSFRELGYHHFAIQSLVISIPTHIKRKNYKTASLYLDMFEDAIKDTINFSSIQISGFYQYKGMLFEAQNKLDSAIFYLHKSLEKNKFTGNLVYAYRELMKIYTQRGQADSVCKYSLLYNIYNDSTTIKKDSEAYIQMHAAYNYIHLEKEAKKKSQQVKHLKHILFSSAILLLLIILFSIKYFQRQRKQIRLEILHQNTRYTQLLQDYSSIQHKIKELNLTDIEKSERLNEYHLQIELLRDQLSHMLSLSHDQIRWNTTEEILSIPEILLLHQKAKQLKPATLEEIQALRKILNKYYPEFLRRLCETTSLNLLETDLCILIKLDYLPTEASVLLSTSKQNITNMRARMYKKITGKSGGATDFDHYIKNMIN